MHMHALTFSCCTSYRFSIRLENVLFLNHHHHAVLLWPRTKSACIMICRARSTMPLLLVPLVLGWPVVPLMLAWPVVPLMLGWLVVQWQYRGAWWSCDSEDSHWAWFCGATECGGQESLATGRGLQISGERQCELEKDYKYVLHLAV